MSTKETWKAVGVEAVVRRALVEMGPLTHPRAGEWPSVEIDHAVELVLAVLPALFADFLKQLLSEASVEEARIALGEGLRNDRIRAALQAALKAATP